ALFGADPNTSLRTGTPDTSPAASERLDAHYSNLGDVYAEDYLQQTAAPVALDVTWNGFETAASFILALASTSTPTPPSNTSLPTISGTAQQGSTLTGDPGTWSGSQPISFAYQWRRCDSAGANCQDIQSASTSTYTLVLADVGSTIRLDVTGSNGA